LLEQLEQDDKRYIVTAFEESEGTLAERIPPTEWTNELYRSIGNAAGKMHAVSKRYQPAHPDHTRPHWFDGFEIQDATSKLATFTDETREKLPTLIQELKTLPTYPADYGLIHDDLHFANFMIEPDGKVTIIDFDDCAYGWFAMDAAMALFDVLVLYHATNKADKRAFARRFMGNYLSGYRQRTTCLHSGKARFHFFSS